MADPVIRCIRCKDPIPSGGRFCPSCGTATDPTQTPTELSVDGGDPSQQETVVESAALSSAPSILSSGSASGDGEGGFSPGQTVAGRYRIVGKLGRGGMGEVYRADDLVLGQTVALKFLSHQLAGDARVRERFYGEVRTARQVTHPNICRVHDIGEADGRLYLSMEYVDGEDLSSLVRRIGHLPQTKAVQIARQLCAGLAAAHQQGLIHRDLKPANIMLDGRGQVRITDFGLAGLAEEVRDIRSGTPAYMAPEQLAGREVTARSDIYALGLVLYEVFTGKPPFKSDDVTSLKKMQETQTPASLTTLVDDVDPVVERVIMRCLEKDPEDRPESVVTIIAALPGGDPLAAAIAAGETPSPELVAAAGAKGTMSLPVAMFALVVVVGSILGMLPAAGPLMMIGHVEHKPPAVLEENARELLSAIRPAQQDSPDGGAMDSAGAFAWDWQPRTFAQNRKDEEATPIDWTRLPMLYYWYRESPDSLEAERGFNSRVSQNDPPLTEAGMTRIFLDATGKLLEYRAVPASELVDDAAPPAEVDWAPFFEAAGIDPAALYTEAPKRAPPDHADQVSAWSWTDEQNLRYRIEAASRQGTPQFFAVLGPWNTESLGSPPQQGVQRHRFVTILVLVSFISLALTFAVRNLKRGRGDLRGATRLGVFAIVCHLGAAAIRADLASSVTGVWGQLVRATGFSLFIAMLVWVLYLALEPYVRRRNPQSIVSWTRLVSGRWRDPLVARDLLLGLAAGCLISFVLYSPSLFMELPQLPQQNSLYAVQGFEYTFGQLLFVAPDQAFGAMFIFFVWFALRWVFGWLAGLISPKLRLEWMGDLLLLALMVLNFLGQNTSSTVGMVFGAIAALILTLTTIRLGLLALVGTLFAVSLVANTAVPLDFSVWWATNTLFLWLIVAGLAAWCAHSAVGRFAAE